MNMHMKVASPLSRKAILVSVKVSQWTARKLDRQITNETNRRHGASDDAGRYNKLLIDSKHLSEITTLVAHVRALHVSMTSPWANDGARVLPNALYSKFADEFRKIKRAFNAACDRFAAAYPSFIEERKLALQGAFKPEDYPSADQIRSKFAFEMKVLPFPDVADFRADIDDETFADIKHEIEQSSGNAAMSATKDMAQRVIDVVGKMAEKLKEYGQEGKSPKFKPLIKNVRELAEILPSFNFDGDIQFAALADRISKELCVEEADDLRKNDDVREAVAKSADEIVAEMGAFLA